MENFKDLIKPEMIMSGLAARDARGVLTQMVEYLKERGYVEDGYLEMLLEREDEFPTGLATEPFAVALPHTDPVHVLKPCVLVSKLKDSVEFHEMGKENELVKVKYVFVLVVEKSKYHMDVLQRVIGIFMNKSVMNQLYEAEDPVDIANILYASF